MAEALRSSVPVCFVASDAQLGGAELYLGSLLTSLESKWIDDVVVLADGPFVGWLESAGFAPTVIACERRIGLLRTALRLRRIFRRRSTPLVHANGPKAALVSVLAAVGTKTRVLWHKHDPAYDGRLARGIGRRCELVVGVSSSVLGTLAHEDGVRTRVVPNGIPAYAVDRREAGEALRRELETSPESRIVGQVGRLHPGKGQLELLEVAAELRARIPDLRLVFVGASDPHEPDYETLLRRRVTDNGLASFVTFLGYRAEAVTIVAGCDVLAVPSVPDSVSGWREGFGLAAVEAMAVGTPVVAYAEPALVDVLGGCGKLVETGDRPSLLEAIVSLLDDVGERERLADCGRKRVRAFGLAEAVERMKEAYLAAAFGHQV